MSKKGGAKNRKISNVKKNNIKKNKLVRAGKLKPKSKPNFVEGGQFKNKNKGKERLTEDQIERRQEYEDEKKKYEAKMYEEIFTDMMDPEDVEYIKKNANRGKAFNIQTTQNSKKRKFEENDEQNGDVEDEDEGFDEYEQNAMKRIRDHMSNDNSSKTRNLLPVRSENGWEQRTCNVVDKEENQNDDAESDLETEDKTENSTSDNAKQQEPVSVIGILAKRKRLLEESKLQIGSMATNFLENPEERMYLLDRLIKFMTLGQNDCSVEKTVIKLAAASIVEILKDIIPNYKIADHETQDKTVKLKKDTLKLHRYETALLGCIKRFLVKCERIVSDKNSSLAPHAMTCLMELLVSHPEFNYAENIIQFSVAYLNSSNVKLRQTVKEGIIKLFKNDKRGQVSYMTVRSINHHLKSKKREKVKSELLDVLLSLKMYHLENPKDIATGHLEALAKKGKKNREEMSKKERKQAKARAILDKELLEAKAEESTQTRLKYASEVSNLLFAIYFRLIKDPAGGKGEAAIITNRALLRPVLTGLAKFGHLMSIDYFQDLLKVLSELLDRRIDDNQSRYFLGSHEALLCIHTVLSILSGQGASLTLDPQRFYNHLDRVIADLKPTTRNENATYELASRVLREAFVIRRKKISKLVLLQAIKHVGIASLNGGAKHLVPFVKECIQVHPTSIGETLMTKDNDVEAQKASVLPRSGFSSDYSNVEKDPLIWEVAGMSNHCDPKVAKFATGILGITTVKSGKKHADLCLPNNYEVPEDNLEETIDNEFDILLVK